MERKYVKGLFLTKKETKYGSFLKVGVDINAFKEKNHINKRGFVNFCIFESKEGKPYAVIDDYEANHETKDDEQIVQFDEEMPF